MSDVTYERYLRVMAHMNGSCHTWMRDVTHEWWMRHVTCESVMTHMQDEWVISHVSEWWRPWKTNKSRHMTILHSCVPSRMNLLRDSSILHGRHRWFNRDTTDSSHVPEWYCVTFWYSPVQSLHSCSVSRTPYWVCTFIHYVTHMILHGRRRTDLKRLRLPKSNKFSRESPQLSNKFSRESPKFQKNSEK